MAAGATFPGHAGHLPGQLQLSSLNRAAPIRSQSPKAHKESTRDRLTTLVNGSQCSPRPG
jgi:hypothetical protein